MNQAIAGSELWFRKQWATQAVNDNAQWNQQNWFPFP
jgi:hypothetical protein